MKIADYKNYLESTGKSKNTIIGYSSDLRFWFKFALNLKKDVMKLKMKDIEDGLCGRDVNTARRLLASLKSYGRFLNRINKPKLIMELMKVEYLGCKVKIPKNLNTLEYQQIIKHAKELIQNKDRRGLWLGLMINCGLRISEIQNITFIDNHIKVIGKGNKERVVPCPDWLFKGLVSFKSKGYGGYLQSRQVIDVALRKLGYTNVHRMRHTYATILQKKDVKIEVIQKLLGHSSIVTTQIYTNTTVPDDIVSKLEI